jgi:hypothetical protein
MRKEYRQNFKEVEKAFSRLQYLFGSLHWGQYGKHLEALHRKEESQHRKGWKPEGYKEALTITESVKLFFVQYIIDCLQGKSFTVKDILHVRESFIYSASLVANYKEDIEKALHGVDFDKILKLDYSDMVKPE